ncbi:MAG: outer membrane protein transport protein, partial [Desulfovibrio sp.]|nr:outer membrane protein transport protein [Desulfovibrio sp.]
VEVLYAGFYMGNKIPTMQLTAAGLRQGPDNDLQLQGDGWGVGAQFGLHMRFNDQWALGVAYKSQVTLNIDGDVEFGRQGEPNLLATPPPPGAGGARTRRHTPRGSHPRARARGSQLRRQRHGAASRLAGPGTRLQAAPRAEFRGGRGLDALVHL